MAKLANLARMTTATTGTGAITLGSAVASFLTFAAAGVADGDVISYAIEDGLNREVGTGTYSSSGPTLTRTVLASTNGGAAINLSGNAQVFVTALAEDLERAPIASKAEAEAGTDNSKMMTPLRAKQGLLATYAGTLVAMQVFILSGTYTPTAGAKKALVFVTGGGEARNSGNAGAAGTTAISFIPDPSAVLVTVGAAGTGQSGADGGDSSFGSLVIARGGGVTNTNVGDIIITGGRGGSGNLVGGPSFWGGPPAYGGGGDGAGAVSGVVVIYEFG